MSSRDKATGREQSVQVVPSSGLSDEEIEQMVREAEAYREEDRRKKEWAETRNAAEGLVYEARRLLREMGDFIADATRRQIEAQAEAVQAALASGDAARVRRAMADLYRAMEEAGARGPDETSCLEGRCD